MPGSAVGADLEPKVVVADQTQFGPAAPAALEQQGQDIARPLLIEGEAQVAVPAALALQRRPQRLVQPGGDDVGGVRLGVHAQTGQVLQHGHWLDRPGGDRRPDPGAANQNLLAIQHDGQQTVRRRDHDPTPGLGAHQAARRSPAPVRAGRVGWQDVERAVCGRGGLGRHRAADHRRLGQGVQTRQRLVQGYVFLQLSGGQIGQAQPRAGVVAHRMISKDWRTSLLSLAAPAR